MKGLETGKDKVKKICDALRRETLEPAIHEAERLLEETREEAKKIIEAARQKSESLLSSANAEIERERSVYQSTIKQASKQAIEVLKEQIEQKLFNRELARMLTKTTQDPKILQKLIEAVIKALEKDGIDTDLSVYVPAAVPARAVNELLGSEILSKLKEKSVLLGPMTGGIEVKLGKENISIDITDQALKELVANYIRKDLREMFFEST